MADKKISALDQATTPLAGTEVLPIVQSGTTKKVANNDLRPTQIQSNATSGVLQVVGPAAAATRVMTVPDANFTAARTDTGQTFTGSQTFSSDQDAILTTIYNTKSSGFNNPMVFLRSDQNTTNDSFRPLAYYNGGAAEYRFYVDDAGKVWTKDNIVIGTSGKGIDFSATPGTGTSELLADYEEGTWTPVYEPDSGAFASVTYDIQQGQYVKVGKLVTITASIRTDAVSLGTASSVLLITGLPFTGSSTPYGGVAIGYTANFNTTAPNQIVIYPTELVVYLTATSSNGYAATNLKNAANANHLIFSATYIAA